MEVMKRAERRDRTHGDVLHLEVGQPSTPAPLAVRSSAVRLLDAHRLGYTHALGVVELRRRISEYYAERHGVTVDSGRIAATVGASGGMVLALLAAFDVGDRVGITEPGYAAYRNIVTALGLELVGIPVGPDTRYVPTPRLLDTAAPLDGLIVASPSNPTGTVLTPSELGAIHGWCVTNDVRLLSDEIYHRMSYGGDETSALELDSDVVVLQSFSKYYSMTGWRVGWLVLPDGLVDAVERLAQNLFICPPALAQIAAVAAFDASAELDANVERYRISRGVVLDALARWDLPHAPPDGAFYVWADVSRLGAGGEVSRRWLDEAGVAVTPGIDFDPVRGGDFVRISYSESPDDVAEAVRRLDRLVM